MLEKLDENQIESLAKFKDKWVKFALYSGDDLDVEEFKKGISWGYKKIKLRDPIKIYVDSPLGLQYACQILKKIDFSKFKSDQVSDQVRGQVSDQVRDQVYGQVYDQVRDQVYGQVYDQVRGQVYDQVSDQVRGQVYDQVRGQVRGQMSDQVYDQVYDQVSDQVRDQVRDQVYDQVRGQVYDQVYDQVRGQVYDQVSDQVRDQVRGQVYDQVRGQYEQFAWIGAGWDAGWNSFYDYFESIGINVTDDFKKYKKFVESGVWDTIMFNNFAIGCRRPNFVSRDTDNRMSNDNRSAISWRDGYELYYLDGVYLPKEMWANIVSKKMTFAEIMKIEISDQRTVALKYNPEAIIKENAELVDKSDRGNELFKIEGQRINKDLGFKKIWFLRMICPTGRIFVEGVPPDAAEADPRADVLQALLCGLTYEQYMEMEMES